jgi:hypothetical protein
MKSVSRYAPWFSSRNFSGTEPKSYQAWKWALQRLSARRYSPTLFERIRRTDWDLLVVLDACRYDVLADLADVAVVDRAISPVCVTQRFVEEVNAAGLFEDAGYVSANPATRNLDVDGLEHVPLYDTAWDDQLSTVRPSAVYDRAVDRVRDGAQVVAHTMQPHYPHICQVGDEVRSVPGGLHPNTIGATMDETPAQNIPYAFFTGQFDADRAMQSYRRCTAFAWQRAAERAVELSKDGYTVVITADHGELLGEWGLAGHPWRVRVRPLVEVPWVVISPEKQAADHEDTVNEKLEALGYV